MTASHLPAPLQLPELPPLSPLSKPQKNSISLIWAHDLSLVREKMIKENLLPEHIIDDAIVEYRKFMALLRLGFQRLSMHSREVDQVWHTHIIFTKNYAAFCDQVFGEFIHHDPITSRTPVEAMKNTNASFFEAYNKVFGKPSSLWPAYNPNVYELCQPTGKSAELCQPTGKSAELCQPTGKNFA